MPQAILTRRQQEIYDFLQSHQEDFHHPPTLDQLCAALGLKSKGSLHKQIQALVDAGLIEPMNNQRRGIRLSEQADRQNQGLPLLGRIAAGQPIEAIGVAEYVQIPDWLHTDKNCFVLEVKGDSMIDEGILDGDRVIVEQRSHAANGEVVVALVDGTDATLKRIEQNPGAVILHPANSNMEPMRFAPEQIQIQGVLVGQMRRYH